MKSLRSGAVMCSTSRLPTFRSTTREQSVSRFYVDSGIIVEKMGKMMLNSHKVGMLFHLLTQASKLNALLTPLASRQDELVAGKTRLPTFSVNYLSLTGTSTAQICSSGVSTAGFRRQMTLS